MLIDGNEIRAADASLAQAYYILGTPISDDGTHLQVISGRIFSKLDYAFRSPQIHTLHDHGSARPGASGRPVFSRYRTDGKLNLLGIVVAGQNINHETTLGTFVSSNYVKIISAITLENLYVHEKNKFKF